MEDGLKCIDIFDCVSSPHVTPDADILLSLSRFNFSSASFLGFLNAPLYPSSTIYLNACIDG